ncbi:hypothetical protein ACIBEK_06690 [Nocardia fusca]|uniref:hypothetical protein n=1 Tax=Nocardia fusca TaxID=941183 RepID=UPI0037B532E7
MRAIADGQNVRTIATAAGLHHPTMQTRLRQLGEQLGFEPTNLSDASGFNWDFSCTLWRTAGSTESAPGPPIRHS